MSIMRVTNQNKKVKALLVGQLYGLTAAPLQLLKRSGFEVDLISIKDRSPPVCEYRRVFMIDHMEQLSELLISLSECFEYDLVVVGDDDTLKNITGLALADDIKMRFLPVVNYENTTHLYSKVELNRVFKESSIRTPPSLVANNDSDLAACVCEIGYPLIIKIDSSGGGAGVFECWSELDLEMNRHSYSYPLLVQKRIEGRVIDLSAIYQRGTLVHFTYSEFVKVESKFGPSSVRKYTQIAAVENDVFDELSWLGKSLGANGFVNITALKSDADGKRYYFEADMRPNVWADFGKFIGDDASIALRQYIATGQGLAFPQPLNPMFSTSMLIPYPMRLSFLEVLLNKYRCWSYVGKGLECPRSVISLLLYVGLRSIGRGLKPVFPKSLWGNLRLIIHRHLLNASYPNA